MSYNNIPENFHIMIQEYWETQDNCTQFDERITEFFYKFLKEKLTKEDLLLIKDGNIPLE